MKREEKPQVLNASLWIIKDQCKAYICALDSLLALVRTWLSYEPLKIMIFFLLLLVSNWAKLLFWSLNCLDESRKKMRGWPLWNIMLIFVPSCCIIIELWESVQAFPLNMILLRAVLVGVTQSHLLRGNSLMPFIRTRQKFIHKGYVSLIATTYFSNKHYIW